ncbi:MAG: sulfite exporter TauE/SafE family protein [Anaerolineae bacterium]|nr:sulfite exporter TauE/SafE family protein [Anaerolineae bacterium]MCB9458439.1 sulfite exporter TauE/SafE family protein [Anaerolineaceae bacterium]
MPAQPVILAALIMFFATLVQSIVGFGSGLISVPLIIPLLGMGSTQAIIAFTGLVTSIGMIWRYRSDMQFQHIWRIILASLIAIPIGVRIPELVPRDTALFALGVIILAYVLYVSSGLHMPHLHNRWGYLIGSFGGLLQGAFNTAGPPYVMFATSQRWPPFEFKGNIQTIFFVSGLFVVLAHWQIGNYGGDAVQIIAILIPARLLGLWLGGKVDRYIQPEPFRKVVLVMLALIGLNLIF